MRGEYKVKPLSEDEKEFLRPYIERWLKDE